MLRRLKILTNDSTQKKIITNQTKEDEDIIYGARSIQKQIGLLSRPTKDYDIFTSNPKKSAMKIEKKLDRGIGFDYFYTKKGVNKTTWKVKGKGYDLVKGTRDDVSVVDYTKTPSPKPKIKKINGLNYRSLNQEIEAKKKALKDKMFAFRHQKDSEDLARIRASKLNF